MLTFYIIYKSLPYAVHYIHIHIFADIFAKKVKFRPTSSFILGALMVLSYLTREPCLLTLLYAKLFQLYHLGGRSVPIWRGNSAVGQKPNDGVLLRGWGVSSWQSLTFWRRSAVREAHPKLPANYIIMHSVTYVQLKRNMMRLHNQIGV